MRVHSLVSLAEAPRGKFVVLRHGEELHFVTAPTSTHPYHAHIVFTFIEEQGRGQAVLMGGTHCTILTEGWKVLGGGHYELNPETRSLRLSEKSTAFGKYPLDVVKQNSRSVLEGLGLSDFRLKLI
jgi:hypothetical protein